MFSIYSRWWCISASLPRYCLRLCPSHCALLPNRPLLYKIWRNCISLWAPHCTVHRQRLSSDPAVLQAAQRRRRSAHAFIFTGGLVVQSSVLLGSEWLRMHREARCKTQRAIDRTIHSAFMGNLKPPSITHVLLQSETSLSGWGLCSLSANSFSQRWLLITIIQGWTSVIRGPGWRQSPPKLLSYTHSHILYMRIYKKLNEIIIIIKKQLNQPID